MRDHDGTLTFRPSLPEAISDINFRLVYRGRRLHGRLTREQAHYSLRAGEPLDISHYGEALTVSAGSTQARPIPAQAVGEPPRQPQGRAPARRQT